MLAPHEQEMLAALEASEAPRAPAQSRAPGDLGGHVINRLTPEEAEQLAALEAFERDIEQRPIYDAPPQQEGLLEQAGNMVDKYSGAASARSAIGAYQDTGSLSVAGDAFIDQFSRHPNMAPTGKEIAERAGFSPESMVSFHVPVEGAQGRTVTQPGSNRPMMKEEVSPAGMAGLAVDMVADPLSLIPFALIGKTGAKGAGLALKGSAKAERLLTGTNVIGGSTEFVADTGKAIAETTRKARITASKLFRPDVAPDYQKLTEIALENGIDPAMLNDAHKFGETSIISRHSRNLAEGPFSDRLQKHEALVQNISEATESNVRKISGLQAIPDNIEAGTILRSAYDEGVDRFFKQMDITYDSVIQMAPDMRLEPKSAREIMKKLDGIESFAKGRLVNKAPLEKVIDGPLSKKREINKATKEWFELDGSTNQAITKEQRTQAKELQNAVQIARDAITRSQGDVKQVLAAMRDISEVAFKSKGAGRTPSDMRKLQEMYFSLQKGLTETARTYLGDDIAKSLIENNKAMSEHFSSRGPLHKLMTNANLDDGKLFESIIMGGDTKKLEFLEGIVDPQAFQAMKGAFLNNTIVRNADEVINFAATRKRLNGLKKSGKLKMILSEAEMQKLDDILLLGDRGGIGVLSTSGTGASNMFSRLGETFKDHVAGEVLVDNLKRGALKRGNYVEAQGGILQKMAPEAAPRSGLQMLREVNPASRSQVIQGTRINAIQERNDKLNRLKAARGY